jgi:CHC2 zinc finger
MQANETTDGQLNRFARSIETVKERVPIEQVAQEYFDARLAGCNRLLARCPSPEHEDKTPSFTIFTDTRRFRCFGIGCGLTGDVVDLEKLCGGHDQLWTALVALSVRYGVELPRRSDKWHHWQAEKQSIEDLAEHIRFQTRCRRLFKLMILNAPEIQAFDDPAERREEIRRCWEAFQEGMREIDHKVRQQRARRLSR